MTVAYDLRYATDHFPGVGTHAFRLLEALMEASGPERYLVLWNPTLRNSRFNVESIRDHARVEWIERPIEPIGVKGAWRLGTLLRERAPDLYFSPFLLMPFRPGCACVLTLHDVLPLRDGTSRPAALLYHLAMMRARKARFVVTSSEFSRGEILKRTRLESARVRVIRPGAPEPSSLVTRPPGLPEGPFALVVGTNRPHKNLKTLALAWKQLGSSPPLQLVGVGHEDQRYAGLETLAARHGASRVMALGPVTEPELAWLYRHATLVLFPTLHEGFGFPMVEAFAHGAVVLASDIPSLRETGEDAAQLLPPRDPSAWAKRVAELAANERLLSAIRDVSRARAAQLSYRECAANVLALLREAME